MSDTPPFVPGFLDRLGDRVLLTDPESGHVEVLRLRPELTASSLFESAVTRRANQLVGFLHPHCARVRQIGRLPAPDGRLVIMSDAVDGWRLSEVLEAAAPCSVAFHADAVLFLLRQLLGTVADLHEVALGVSHGALGTERLVITPDGRLVVTESVLGAALRHLPPMSPDRLWRDLRLAVADREAQPFGRLTDLRQIGIVALSLALGRQLRRDEYPTRLASLLQEWTPARPDLEVEMLGPAFQEWLARVLSLTDELTPWSVAEARRELDALVESDHRYAFAPTGLPEILAAVADYYGAAAGVPGPIAEPASRQPAHDPLEATPSAEAAPIDNAKPPAPDEWQPTLDTSHPVPEAPHPVPAVSEPVFEMPEPVLETSQPVRDVPQPVPAVSEPVFEMPEPVFEVSQPVRDVPQPARDAPWPEPAVRPAINQPVDSHYGPHTETRRASMFAEPASPSSAASAGPAEGVGPLADSIAGEWQDGAADQGGGRQRHAHASVREFSPLLGAHADEDTLDPTVARAGTRTRTLIGVAAAAIVIIALGGYVLVRPSSIDATATRRASSPGPTAVADEARPTPALPTASASPADTAQALSVPQTPEATAPAAEPEPPASTGTIEVVSPVSLNVSEGGRALGVSGEPIRLPVGRHTLDIGREDLEYQAAQVVDVRPGRRVRVEPSLPTGFANLNATPWAEVWVDGRKVGDTPLGRLQLTIGSHEVQFRHPELGDQTRMLVVTSGSVVLLSVDMKK